MSRIVSATTSDEVIKHVTSRFGGDAVLCVVDREFSNLVSVDRSIAPTPLVGELRDAMLCAQRHFDGQRTWIPLPERNHVVFAVAIDGRHTSDLLGWDAMGEVLSGHRKRFEDLERDRRRAEMVVAAELQWDLLPVRSEAFGEYRVAGILEPAYEVAGDVFEYAMNGDAVWAYSFDGMGHGLDATMTSVLVLAAVRNSRRQGATLSEQMDAANATLWDQYGGDRFVTGAACRLDPDGVVEVINAGHEPMRVVSSGRVDRLDLDADLPLGVDVAATYQLQHAASLAPGDGLVMFSDGPAAQSSSGQTYGDDHLDHVLADKWSDVPLQTGHDVIGDVLDFIGDGEVQDDITAVVIRRSESRSTGR